MTLRSMAVALALLAPRLAVAAPEPPPSAGPEAFVRWVDAHYTPGGAFDSRTVYSPGLRALFRVNARLLGPGDVGENDDDDEVCQCQDWDHLQLTALSIRAHGPDRALARASFHDGAAHDTVTLELLRTPKGWRIDDVVHPRPGAKASLRARILEEDERLRPRRR